MDRKLLENYRIKKINLQDRLEELREKKKNVNRLTASYSGEKVSSSRAVEDGTAERLVVLLDNTKQVEELLKLLWIELEDIENSIFKIQDPNYQCILYKKYILNEKLEEIADELHYDYKYLCRLHGYALKEWDKL